MITLTFLGWIGSATVLLISGGVLVWALGEIKEWRRRPRASVSFELSPDCIVENTYAGRDDSGYLIRHKQVYVRIGITNIGKSSIANCRAWLVGIDQCKNGKWEATKYTESLPMIWSYMPELEVMPIPEGVTVHCDAILFDTAACPRPRLWCPSHPELVLLLYEKLFQTEGHFRYRIAVSADKLPPEHITIEYLWKRGNCPTLIKNEIPYKIPEPTEDDPWGPKVGQERIAINRAGTYFNSPTS